MRLWEGGSAEGGFYGSGASRVRDAIAGSGGKKKRRGKKLRDVVMVKTVIDDSRSEKGREGRVGRGKKVEGMSERRRAHLTLELRKTAGGVR